MADGGLHQTPYAAVVELIHWIDQRRRRIIFNGWALARGRRIADLNAIDLLDLLTYHIIEQAVSYDTEEQHKKRIEVQDLLIGELTYDATRPIGEIELETGIKPPLWFNATGGVTLSQINMTAQRTRR